MIKKILLNLILTFTLASSSYAYNKNNAVLIVNLFEPEDSSIGSHDHFYTQMIKELEIDFPQSEILILHAQSNEELRLKLEGLFGGQSPLKLDGLFVSSHGLSGEHDLRKQNLSPSEKVNANKKYYAHIGGNSGKVSVFLNRDDMRFYPEFDSDETLQSAFAPLIGKFNDNAVIAFNSCNLLALGKTYEKRSVMIEVAKKFGLKNGSLYMNYTEGRANFSTFFKQPYYAHPQFKDKLKALGIWAVWPISMPMTLVYDNLIDNKGYTLEISTNSNAQSEYKMIDEHFFTFLKNQKRERSTK